MGELAGKDSNYMKISYLLSRDEALPIGTVISGPGSGDPTVENTSVRYTRVEFLIKFLGLLVYLICEHI